MKNLINLSLMFFAVLLMSCETDPCKETVCGDFGTCDEGVCLCEDGYEQGTDGQCNVEMRAKFIGEYNFTETCNTASGTYKCTISNSAQGVNKIVLEGLYAKTVPVPVVADIISSTEFSIPANTPFDGSLISGTGIYNDITGAVTISLTYKIDNASTGASDNCSGTMSPL